MTDLSPNIQLFSSFLNSVGVGVIGIAVIGPIFQPDNPLFIDAGLVDEQKFRSIVGDGGTSGPRIMIEVEPTSIFQVISWKGVGFGVIFHVAAQLLLLCGRSGEGRKD